MGQAVKNPQAFVARKSALMRPNAGLPVTASPRQSAGLSTEDDYIPPSKPGEMHGHRASFPAAAATGARKDEADVDYVRREVAGLVTRTGLRSPGSDPRDINLPVDKKPTKSASRPRTATKARAMSGRR